MIPVRPSKIIGIGRNYAAHAQELGHSVPASPIVFFKPPSSIIATGQPIMLPRESIRVEYEAEIGIVVGRRLRRASLAEAERGIQGYVCVNDVTARDLQHTDGQWGRAKGFDSFCPVGPRVADGLGWRDLEIICRVNGQERQRAKSADMIFSIPTLVSFVSGIMTLEPGDLITTGTPAGTRPLQDGDVVEVEIPGVGVLSNPVRKAEQ